MASAGRTGAVLLLGMLVLGVEAAAPPPALAQSNLIDPWNAQARRTLRDAERQAPTDPAGAAARAAAGRAALRSQAQGVYLGPEQQRLDRQLGTVEQDAAARAREQATPSAPATVPQRQQLPSSTEQDPILRPSGQPYGSIGTLLDRAEEGIADGRPASARSDLSLARSQIDSLRRSGTVAAGSDDIAALEARAAKLDAALTP